MTDTSEPRVLMAPQPPPVPSDAAPLWPRVQADLEARASEAPPARAVVLRHLAACGRERDRQGREKYGEPLRPYNGRDYRADLAQEIADAYVYAEGLALAYGDARHLDRADVEQIQSLLRRIWSILYDLPPAAVTAPSVQPSTAPTVGTYAGYHPDTADRVQLAALGKGEGG